MELDRNQALKRIRALKRIQEEYREIESNPSDEFMCGLLKRKKFQWQFAVRGACGTEFEGGIYHGRVRFPREYPCKPPSIIALTENGRVKTYTKVSLRRLDKWQPSYRVRDVFVEFVYLMPTPTYPDELCSLERNKEERRALAIESRAAAPKYGTSDCQKVIEQIHQYMLSKAPNGTGGCSVPSRAPNGTGGCSVPSQAPNGTGGGSVPSQASNGTGGVHVHIVGNGNIFCATNSDGVGILGCMNEFGAGILGSMYEAFIRGGGTLGRKHGSSVVNNIIISQNTIYATNSNRVGVSLSTSRNEVGGAIRNMVLVNTVFTFLGLVCNFSVLFCIFTSAKTT